MEVPRLGRKWAMVISALLMGASLIMYQLVDSIAANIGFNAMDLYNALLYAFTPEIFPAPFRGSASGMLSTLGRIAGIVSAGLVKLFVPFNACLLHQLPHPKCTTGLIHRVCSGLGRAGLGFPPLRSVSRRVQNRREGQYPDEWSAALLPYET
uniref:Major facilitator superfamily (MFS) profile domain-containing protein n=1 Tax=Solanum lycopersicum TaxID=4081 RepID=A0A494G9M1_SOLLC